MPKKLKGGQTIAPVTEREGQPGYCAGPNDAGPPARHPRTRQRRSRAGNLSVPRAGGPVDEISDAVPYSTGNEQSAQRLFGRLSAHISFRLGTLLVYRGGGLTCLVSYIFRGTLDRSARLAYRLNPGSRCLASQLGCLVDRLSGARLQTLAALIDLILNYFSGLGTEVTNRVLDLCCRLAHHILAPLLIHRSLSALWYVVRVNFQQSESQNTPLRSFDR